MRSIAPALLLFASACSCQGEVRRPPGPGFDDPTVELCATGTDAVTVRTARGGTLAIAVLDACGRVLQSCTTPDVFAPGGTATIRIAGEEVLAEGCVIPAAAGSILRARFIRLDAGTEDVETHDARLVGCREAGGPSPPDAAAACDVDAGPPPDAGDAG